MQSRNIHGYPQQQYYDDDDSWMETKAQQNHGYPQTQQYPGMKPGAYGNESDYSMPNHHGHDSNHNMYHQDSMPHGHGNGHGHGYGGGHKDYVSKYEVYKEEHVVGSGVTKRNEVRYERRGTYGGDVHHANPYGYNNNMNNPQGHGTKKGNWTLKGF